MFAVLYLTEVITFRGFNLQLSAFPHSCLYTYLHSSLIGLVIPTTLNMAVMHVFRVAGLALRLTGWCQEKWHSTTGNLPRKRRKTSDNQFINLKFNETRLLFISVLLRGK